jgi:hypothetical protein
MVSEIEARVCQHDSITPARPVPWVRSFAPLIAWAAFFVVMIVGGALAPSPSTQIAAYVEGVAE